MKQIEEICEILDSKRIPITASEREPGPYPYYGANGVQDYVAGYIFDDELVLLAEDGGNFGSKEKPIAYRVSGKCWVNNHAHVLKPKPGIDVDYLCYSLMYYDVSSLVNGATRQKLTQADMRKMEISVPPIEKQQYIATMLDKVSDLFALRKQQLAKLDELVKARFVERFDGKFQTVKIGDMFETTSGGTPSKKHPEYYEKGDIPWLTSSEVNAGIISQVKKRITRAGVDNSSAKMIPLNSVVIAMYGATAGQVGLLQIETTTNQAVCSILPNPAYIPEFLYYAIKSKKAWMVEQSAGGAQPNISQGVIKRMEIISPPIELQAQFAAFVQQTEKSKLTIQQGLDKLETIKKALMQKYFG